MSKEDIRETVANDCADFWSRATIRKWMPDEYKDPQKREAGKKSRESQRLEEPILLEPFQQKIAPFLKRSKNLRVLKILTEDQM